MTSNSTNRGPKQGGDSAYHYARRGNQFASLFITITILLLCLFICEVEGKIYHYKYITNNKTSDHKAAIHKNWISWLGTNEDGYGILFQDVNSGVVKNITVQSGLIKTSVDFIDFPSMNEGTVTFRFHKGEIDMDYIYIYDGIQDQLNLISQFEPGEFGGGTGYPPSFSSLRPMINSGQVVWAQWDGNDYEIMFYNGQDIIQITDNSFNDYEPQIYNGSISWTGHTTENLDVYYYDGNVIQNITVYNDHPCEDSFISKEKMAFYSRTTVEDKRHDFDIFVWDSQAVQLVSPTFGNDYEPEINENGIVAWTNYGRIQGESDRCIFSTDGYKLFKAFPDIDIPKPHNVALQSTYGSKILAMVFDGNDLELVLADYITGYFEVDSHVSLVDLKIVDDYAYVVSDQGDLRIVDISDPSEPNERNHITIQDGTRINDLEKSGSFFYLANMGAGVKVVDVNNPLVPETKTTIPTNDAHALVIDRNYLFVSDGSDGMKIFDITNPLSPEQKIAVPISGGSTVSIAIQNNAAFLANRRGGMGIVDVANIEEPQSIGSYFQAGIDVVELEIGDNYAYLLCLEFGIRIIDITNPETPVFVGGCILPGLQESLKYYVTKIFSHLFISTGDGGMFVVDVFNPAEPKIVERIDTLGETGGLDIYQNYLCISDGSQGMKIMDVSDYISPAVAFIDEPSDIPTKIYDTDSFILSGFGVSSQGTIAGYKWYSDLDGIFSTENTADLQQLGYGWHNIEFSVQNSDGSWSQSKKVGYYIYPGSFISEEDFNLEETSCRRWEASTDLLEDFEYKFAFFDIVDDRWIYSPYSAKNYAEVPEEISTDYIVRLFVKNKGYVGNYEVIKFEDGKISDGDIDGDCDVDGKDLSQLVLEFGRRDCTPENRCLGDLDNDGDIDDYDLQMLASKLGSVDI